MLLAGGGRVLGCNAPVLGLEWQVVKCCQGCVFFADWEHVHHVVLSR